MGIFGFAVSAGRCRTLPAASAQRKRYKLALLTCQDYTNGYYGALAHVARDESIDHVLHLGDFIYETAGDPRFQSLPFADRTMVLPSGGTVALDVNDYRFIYRTIRRDPNVQALMERHTLICVPDDHETANDTYWDYARDTLGAPDHPYTTDPKYGNSPALLKQLKLDSQRAWTEYVPARVSFNSNATHPFDALTVYRRFDFAGFLDLLMIEPATADNRLISFHDDPDRLHPTVRQWRWAWPPPLARVCNQRWSPCALECTPESVSSRSRATGSMSVSSGTPNASSSASVMSRSSRPPTLIPTGSTRTRRPSREQSRTAISAATHPPNCSPTSTTSGRSWRSIQSR